MKNEVRLVEQLLMHHTDIQLMVYTGQNDLIVETPGTLRWVERLHYADGDKFR
jgi:serine carboxypeptidase 1